jgi:enterobacterial common antigen flippase
VLTARVLGASGRGEMSAMIVWPALLAYLMTLGLPGAITYWVRREPHRRSEFFTVAVAAAALMSIIALAAGVLLIPVWLRSYPIDVVRAAQFLMIFSPEVMLGLIFTAMLGALGQFNIANATRYVTVSATLVALIILTLLHRMTPLTAAIAYTAAPIIAACWIGWRLRSYLSLRLFDPRPALRALTPYGIRSYGVDLLTTMSVQIDQLVVIGFLGATDVGIYVVALNASRVIIIIHGAVTSVLTPSASGLGAAAAAAMVARAARVSNMIAVAIGIVFAAALPIVLPLFYGRAFASAVQVAQLLTLEAVLSGLTSVLSQAFLALGRPGIVALLQGVGLATVLPLMVVLLPHFGLVGAAGALLLSTLSRLAFIIAAYILVLRLPVPSLVPTRADLRALRNVLAAH